MRSLAVLLFVMALVSTACGGGSSPKATEAPKTPEDAAERFLSLWKDQDYDEMYGMLSNGSQETITREKFVERYQAITEEATISDIDYQVGAITESEHVQAAFSVTFHTAFFGDITQDNSIPLVREEAVLPTSSPGPDAKTRQEWHVVWTPSLFFKEIDDRSLVHFDTRVPRRGAIFDRNARPLAVDAALPVVGIVPDLLTDREGVIGTLSQALGMPPGDVRAKVESQAPGYYFVPVKTLAYNTAPEEVQRFRDMVDLGVVVREETQRLYPNGSAAAHVVGYMTEVTPDELEKLKDKGFRPGDMIGAFGLEGQMDGTLAGERGARLVTITPEGSISATIAEKPAVAGKDIYLAIDMDVQKKAEAELGERVGSIAVMDPRDNSVLALASYPRFDPNAFVRGLTQEEFTSLSNDPRQPFLHRPLLASYPPGSTFKVVTMSAGIERGGFSTGSTIHCSPTWSGLGEAFVKNNWQTVDRGYLTPAEGLMASCNPVFYEMAKSLDERDENALPEVTRQFGFGSPTGVGMEEAAGVVPDAKWKQENIGEPWYRGDAVNMGIGQGFVLATPLQITNMYSAISVTGALRKPLLIKKIVEPVSGAAQEFQAEQINPLPVSQTTLDAVRQGLGLVIHSTGGTSYQAWAGSSVDAAGKSGTAEDLAFGANHIFFVAYANRGDPSIVALAALETGESGSREAAPMVRRILEGYIGGTLGASQ